MKEYYFPIYKSDEEKEKFYDEYKRIKDTYTSVGADWNGDYLVATYEDAEGNRVELWDNMELGICHSIKYLDESKKVESNVHFPLSDEDQMMYYEKTVGTAIPYDVFKIDGKYYDINGTELDENGKDLTESKKVITEDSKNYGLNEINIIVDEFEKLYEKNNIDKSTLINNGEIRYMNGNMGTDGDWADNNHVSYFMSFYKETGLGFAKITIDADGNLYGCYWLDNGKGEAIDIESRPVTTFANEFAAFCFQQTDELGLYDTSIDEINWKAKLGDMSYDWLYGYTGEEEDYWDEDEEDSWDEEDEYYESFHKVQETKNINEDINGDIFDGRDREIFKNLANQKEDKTIYDMIQDRIGMKMTVGELNTFLKNIFSKHDEAFLLESMIYDADPDEPQSLVIYDDNEDYVDEYTITFDIIDLMEATIEITDVDILELEDKKEKNK